MSHRHAIGWILLIWTLSSALALPNFIYSTDLEDRLTNDNVAVTCTMLWPDGRYPTSSYDHIYNIVILVVTYLVPILTMAILYYRVGKELWGYEAIGENIDKQQRAIMAKKKIVKMMIVVVIIFALCWLPYHAFFVVNYYLPNIFSDSPLQYQRGYLFFYWLAMSNSMYNPIIIYFMNSKFRLEFKKILCLICCCRIYRPPLRPGIVAQPIVASATNNQQHRLSAATTNNQQTTNGRRKTNDSTTDETRESKPNFEPKFNLASVRVDDDNRTKAATVQEAEREPFISINSCNNKQQIVNNNPAPADRLIDLSNKQQQDQPVIKEGKVWI